MAKTKAHAQAENKLSAELRDDFNLLVEDYKAASKQHTGQVWVNYNILSDLIRGGWCKTT